MPGIWDDVDAVLATPPPTRPPSVWDEADELLATPPPVMPARALSPASADRQVPGQLSQLERDTIAGAEAAATPAPLPGPPVPPAPGDVTVPGYFNPKTGTRVQTPAPGAGMLEGAPMQIAQGVGGLAKAAIAPTGPPVPGRPRVVNPKTGTIHDVADIDPATIQAANDLTEGLMKAATPLVVAGAAAAPVDTALGLVQAGLAAHVGQSAAAGIGATPEVQSLVGNVAAVLSGTVSAGDVVEKIRSDARAVAAQARAFDAAHPEPAEPEGPIQTGAGATDAARARQSALPEQAGPAGVTPIEPAAVVPPELVRPGDESIYNAARTDTISPDTLATIDQVLQEQPRAEAPTPNELAQREAAAAPPLAPGLRPPVPAPPAPAPAADAGVPGPAVQPATSVSPDTLAEIDRVLEEQPHAVETGPQPIGDLGEHPGADEPREPAALAPADRGDRPGEQPPAPVVGEAVPGPPVPAAAPPGAVTVSPPALPDERRIEAPDGRPPEVPVAAEAGGGPLPDDHLPQRAEAASERPESPRERQARRQAQRTAAADAARADEADTLDGLVARAREAGFAGDHDALRRELADRLQLLKDLDAEFTDSGHNPETLLRAIAHAGGISAEKETALTGEIEWLKQARDLRPSRSRTNLQAPPVVGDTLRGVSGVFRNGGLTLDGMLEALRQEPRFAHIETVNDLLDEIRTAASPTPDRHLLDRFTRGLGDRWWEGIGTATPSDEDADIAFNPEELEQQPLSTSDTLDTGEKQPRLPGGDAARQVGKADTSFRAPVQATGDDFAQRFLGEHEQPIEQPGDLFAPPDDKPKSSQSSVGAPRRPGPPVPPRRSSGGVDVAIVPGGRQFLERDVAPGLTKAAGDVVELRRGIRAVWAPDTVSPPAEMQGAIMRSNLAVTRQRSARAQKAMKALEKAFDRIPVGKPGDQPSTGTQLAFAMAIDEGRVDELPEALRAAAKIFDEITQTRRREVTQLGLLHNWLEHYFPREWAKPGQVRALLQRAGQGRKPLQGRQRYRKARRRKDDGEIYSFREMLIRGLAPVETNPVRAYLRKWLEMDKSAAARRIIISGKQHGTSRFIRVGAQPPEGWRRYDDSFGTVYGKPTVTIREAYDELLMQGLNEFAESIGAAHRRTPKMSRGVWGSAEWPSGQITTRFGGPETVLMHELGHILDFRYGLGRDIGLAEASERQEEKNFSEPARVTKELAALADLRDEGAGPVSGGRRAYVRKREEKIANLVHAFIWNPEKTKDVAPTAYWALYNLAKDHVELRPLLDLQKTRSLRLGTAQTEVGIGGAKILGHYYGPPDAVRLLDNYLSPGLRGNAAFDLYRTAGNFMNQVQLGLSLFHFVGTSLNSVISKGALALEHASRGEGAAALQALAETPVAPLVDVVRGHRALKEFYHKDANFRSIVHAADAVTRGGGGVGWDTFWHDSAPEKFVQAFRGMVAEAKAGNYPGAALRAGGAIARLIPVAVEGQAKLVLQYWVPRLKIAAFLDLYRMELDDLGPQPDEMELRKAAGKAWDAVDNRFGELVYDNLFWSNTLKDAGMATVRALGWNVGTVREVFGAIPAQARQLGATPDADGTFGRPTRTRNTGTETDAHGTERPVYEDGPAPALTHKFAYFVSLVFLSAVFGAIYQYFSTGLRPGEQEDGATDPSTALLDLYFPRTGGVTNDGRPERASLPTYVKDVYAFLEHPETTASHKLNPLLALLAEIVNNEDYFGNAMRNEDDPLVQQVADTFKFAESQYRPISVQSYFERQKDRKGGAISAAESFMGINVAPAAVTRTPLENYLHDVRPPSHRTKDQAAAAAARRDVKSDLALGDRAGAVAAARTAGMTPRSWAATVRSERQSNIQRAYEGLSLREAIEAYRRATPQERLELQPLLDRKARSAEIPPGEVDELRRKLREAVALPAARRPPPVPPRPAASAR